jgi:hypothetical protein
MSNDRRTNAKMKWKSRKADPLFKGADELCESYENLDSKETPAVVIAACLRRLQRLSLETKGEYNGAIMMALTVSLLTLVEAEFT